jgi:hypothetical protein
MRHSYRPPGQDNGQHADDDVPYPDFGRQTVKEVEIYAEYTHQKSQKSCDHQDATEKSGRWLGQKRLDDVPAGKCQHGRGHAATEARQPRALFESARWEHPSEVEAQTLETPQTAEEQCDT